jgi:hypothetical protein
MSLDSPINREREPIRLAKERLERSDIVLPKGFFLSRNYRIMRPTVFSANLLRQFLRRNRIATLPQLRAQLGTEADITIFRKLKELSYLTSYSHRGRFYTAP